MKSLYRRIAIALGCLLLLSSNILLGQDDCDECKKIRRSNQYYWAESRCDENKGDISYEDARTSALEIILQNVSQQVIATATINGRVDNDGHSTQEFVKTIKSYTNVFLEDLTVIELSPEPQAKLFCYVEKEKVKDIFAERENQIRDFVASGKRAEKNLQIDDALRFYYWALMLSASLPQNMTVEFNDQRGYATTILSSKIRSILNNLECKVLELEENEYKEYNAYLNFTYCGYPVSSLQYKYYNGQSMVGPITAKDGKGEAVLLKLPPDGKMELRYEYRFADEANQLLPKLFESIPTIVINEAKGQCVVEKKKGSSKPSFKAERPHAEVKGGEKSQTDVVEIQPEETNEYIALDMQKVNDPKPYQEAMAMIENAIRQQNPRLAFSCMTPDCFQLFDQLLTKTGKVSLSKQEDYEFIQANGEVLGRFIYVKLKVAGGKTFMDKLVFRFSPENHKAHSFAFGLTDIAEANIFDEAKNWPSVSRFTILNFMEDYQTAFAMKREKFLSAMFSDSAKIIVGNELLTPPSTDRLDVIRFNLDNNKTYVFKKYNKTEYMKRLTHVFETNSYIHLTLEDNTTKTINTQGVLEDNQAFGIQIKQMYNSSTYTDRGYLTLMLRMDLEKPLIVVRYWQPDKEEMIDMGYFFGPDVIEW